MRAPTLPDFLDLVAVRPASCNGFPDNLQRNHGLFTAWLTSATDDQRAAVWVLLKRLILCGFTIYFTATQEDKGFRVGIRGVGNYDAEKEIARFRFPENEKPWFDIYACTVQKTRFPKQLRLQLLDGDDLSGPAQGFAGALLRLAPKGAIIARFLVNTSPYLHPEARWRMAHRLPCSPPRRRVEWRVRRSGMA